MDCIFQIVTFVIQLMGFALFIFVFIWLFARPLLYSYQISHSGIDIMFMYVYKMYYINFDDIVNIRVENYLSALRNFNSISNIRKTKNLLDTFYPKRVMVITTSGKIQNWILSTTPLEYISNNVKISIEYK